MRTSWYRCLKSKNQLGREPYQVFLCTVRNIFTFNQKKVNAILVEAFIFDKQK